MLGTTVINKSTPSFGATAPLLGQAGIVGEVDQGPEGPTLVRTINEWITVFGPRTTTSSIAYDWADAFFALGGRRLYFVRPLNSGAATAKLALLDSGGKPTLTVTYATKGTAGNAYKIEVKVAESKAEVRVLTAENELIEANPPGTQAEVIAWWAKHTAYIKVVQSEEAEHTSNLPATLVATKLAGGANPTALTDTELTKGLPLLTPNLGPMRLAIPGHYSEAIHKALAEQAALVPGRRAVGDLEDSPSPTTLIAGKGTIPIAQQSYIDFTSGSAIIPGVTPGTTRKVAGSALFCALGAQVAATGNMNQAAAGVDWPVSPYVLSFTNTFSHAQQEELVEHGINVWGEEQGVLCLIGFVSAVSRETDEIFWSAAAGAERMALDYEGGLIMAGYNFKTIDGQGHLITKCKGELMGLINRHYMAGALFGDSAPESGSVEMGEPINTLATEQKGELNAQMQVRISEYAQATTLTIVSRPITQSVAS